MSNGKNRQVWFITRPERDPAFHKEALEALKESTNNFSIKWKGNREAHKAYEQSLIDMELKRNSISNDGSGGRTWAAMLRTFAYCYINTEGYIVLTKVGEEILKGNNVQENITKQILTLQIPNSYFLESGFRPQYESDFKIRPVRFLIKLCSSSELNYYLTKEEITYFVMTAHKDSEYNDVIKKIKLFRNSTDEIKKEIKEEIACNFDHRERSDNAARNYESAHSDVAHTFMLISEYTGLVEYIRGQAIKISADLIDKTINTINKYDSRYPYNNRYLFSLERMAETNGLDINSYKASRYGNIKPATNSDKKLKKAKKILASKPNCTYDEAVNILSNEFIIKEAEEYAKSIVIEDTSTSLNEYFIESYLNETDNLEFENKTGDLFKLIGFDVEMHPRIENEKTEIDILLKYDNDLCGIIDAKNYKNKFTLSASLASHMASEYIPNYKEYNNHRLTFWGYITSNNIGGVKNLPKISQNASRIINIELPGFMMNAKSLITFIDYCNDKGFSTANRIKLFLKLIDNSSYTNFIDIRKKIEN